MAEENLVTNIVATSDFSGLIGDLNKVSSRLIELQQQLNNTNKTLAVQAASMQKAFAGTMRSTGQFSTHFVSLSSDVEKFGKSLDSGKMKLSQYYRAWQENAKTSGGLIRDLAKQQVQMQNAILQPLGKNAQGLEQFNVHIPRGLDVIKNKTAIASQELKIMNKVIQDGANQVINWGKNTQWAGRQLSVGLTLPIAAFGKAASDAFKQADMELVRLTKVYGGVAATSTADLLKIRKAVSATAKEMSSSLGASYTETIALAADIAATGKQGQDLIASTKETTRLAVLGEVDRQTAMKATLAIQNTFKQNTTELSKSINFLNAVENQTSTSLGDLIEAIPKAGPVIQAMGGSIKDLALYLTAMKEGGIDASAGANALKSALASLVNPTKAAKDLLSGFGINLGGIVTKNAGNLTGTILELQSALDKLDPLKKTQAIEQLFGKFQFARMNALFANLGKQGSQTLQVLDLMKASSQDLANIAGRELAQVTESASGRYKRAVETLKADLAGVGENFLKISTGVLKAVDSVIKFFNKLPGPIKTALGFLTALTALTGPIIMLTGLLANFFGYIIKGAFHLKSLFKGGEGFKLLTPEILAAQKAASGMETTFYSDAKAAAVLQQAISNLAGELTILEQKANAATISVNPAITTLAGNVIAPGSARVADPNHPLIGPAYSRASAHLNPVAGMTSQERLQQTIFGMAPGPIPVNQKIGKNPQMYMSGDMPKIEGVTSIKGVSTGIVAEEAAKWHAMTAALSMQSEAEIKTLKTEVAATGTITAELSGAYQALLPEMTDITAMAAQEAKAIVAELQAGKTTVDQARAKIIQLNATVESMMAETTASVALSQGRTANITTVPLTGQPVVDPTTGKSNMKEMFHKSNTSSIVDKIARALGVKTSGGGYSIETTKPRKFATGGSVVPGNGNSDTVPAMLTPGEFVINKKATSENLPLLEAINGGAGSNGLNHINGGIISELIKLPRAFKTPGGNLFARAFFDTKTGGNATKQRQWLLDSMQMFGRLYPKPNGSGFYHPSEIQAMPEKQMRSLWKGIEKGHFSAKRQIAGSENYFVPGVMGPQSSSANKKAISGGNAADFAHDLQNVPIHPMVIMRSAAEALGYDGNPKQFNKAYNALITALEGKGKSKNDSNFGPGNTFEMFAEKILARHLTKIKNTTGGNFFDELLSYGTVRGKQDARSIDKLTGLPKSGTGSLYPALVKSYVSENKGASLSTDKIDQLTANWPKKKDSYQQGYQYKLGNQDPLHGPLQIGLSQNLKQYAGYDPTKFMAESVAYRDPKFNRLNVIPAFLTGDMKRRGMLATSRYMAGDLDVMSQMERLGTHELGPIAAMKSLQNKFTGKLYRGILAGKTNNAMPQHIQDAILEAKQTGDWSNVVGQEFIMRRSSWSKDQTVANYFAMQNSTPESILLEAVIRNRNILDAGKLFPNRVFRAPYGQSYPQGKFGGPVERSEQEAIFGGKFKIVGYKNGAVQIETVAEAREHGGPVNAGQPYLVGEKGPELFVPRNSGGIIPGYSKGGKIAGFVAKNAASMVTGAAGAAVGGKLAGSGGAIAGSIIGGMLPFMLPSFSKSAEEGAVKTGMLSRAMTGLKAAAAFLGPWGIAGTVAVTGLTVAFIKYKKHADEVSRINSLAFSGAIQPLKNLDEQLKNVRMGIADFSKKTKDMVAANTGAAIPGVSISVKEFVALQNSVKKTYPDIIKLFDQTPKNKLQETVMGIKAQLIAAGDSADIAQSKVAALLAQSKQSGQMKSILSSTGVLSLRDAESAAKTMLVLLTKAQAIGGAKNFAGSMIQAFTSLDAALQDAAKTDGPAKALDKQFKSIANSQSKNLKLTKEQIAEISKTNPILGNMLSTSDKIGDAYAKWRIALAGVNKDLTGLNSTQLQGIAKWATGVQDYFTKTADVTSKEAQSGPLGALAKSIDSYNKKQLAMQSASEAASKKTITSIKDQITLKQKQIKQIEDEANARKKALQDQQQAEDIKLQIQQEQLKYQDALSAGDMASAAQSQLNIKRLVGSQQQTLASDAIDTAAKTKIDKLQAEVEKLNGQGDTASSASTYSAKTSPASAIYADLNTLLQTIERDRPGKANAEDQKTFEALMVKLRQVDPNAAKSVNPSGTGLKYIGSSMGRPAATDLNNLVANTDTTVTAQVAKNTGETTSELKEIKKILSGRQDVGSGSGKRNDPYVVSGNQYKNSAGFIDLEKIIKDNKLSKGDYFQYAGQLYRANEGYDAVIHWGTPATRIKMARGGSVYGPGSSTSDSVPAYLSKGEYVVNAASVQHYGKNLFDGLNAKRFAAGGVVGPSYSMPATSYRIQSQQSGGGSADIVYNTTIELNGTNVTMDDAIRQWESHIKMRDIKSGRPGARSR